nr:heme exporter protein CcmB [Legionellales bacterium]
MKGVWMMIERQWRLALRHPAEILNPLILNVLIVSLFPLALRPNSVLLQQMGPA